MVAPLDSIDCGVGASPSASAAQARAHIVHVADMMELQALRNAEGPCVIDFYADWCGPCKAIASQYEALAGQFPGVTFAKVNIDHVTDPSITGLPTFQVWRNGELIGHVVGAKIDALKRTIVDALQDGAARFEKMPARAGPQ